MSFYDPEKAISMLQALDMMSSGGQKQINEGLGKTFMAVGINKMIEVGGRIHEQFGGDMAVLESFYRTQGIFGKEQYIPKKEEKKDEK